MKLKRFIKKHKIKQTAIANDIGKSQPFVSRLLNGKCVSAPARKKILELLYSYGYKE